MGSRFSSNSRIPAKTAVWDLLTSPIWQKMVHCGAICPIIKPDGRAMIRVSPNARIDAIERFAETFNQSYHYRFGIKVEPRAIDSNKAEIDAQKLAMALDEMHNNLKNLGVIGVKIDLRPSATFYFENDDPRQQNHRALAEAYYKAQTETGLQLGMFTNVDFKDKMPSTLRVWRAGLGISNWIPPPSADSSGAAFPMPPLPTSRIVYE